MISVIIPTYNRHHSLLRLLESLARQGVAAGALEVIVVDDGSSDESPTVQERPWPFTLRYSRQPQRGATEARNHGARLSRGEILVLVDDDVSLEPGALVALAAVVLARPRAVSLAAVQDRCGGVEGPFARATLAAPGHRPVAPWLEPVSALQCNTQCLAVRRELFFDLGMLQDPTGGWPNWDDVDFGARAIEAGYELLRCGAARALHWDHTLQDVRIAAARWGRAGHSAARLFVRHPALEAQLPMFADKGPIRWGRDDPRLVARKVARRIASTTAALALMGLAVRGLERRPVQPLLAALYRWIIGGNIYRGYRRGLRLVRAGSAAGPREGSHV